MQHQTIFQLIYAYSTCFCLFGLKQLAGNLRNNVAILSTFSFLGEFAQFQKSTIILAISVHLSVSVCPRNKSVAT